MRGPTGRPVLVTGAIRTGTTWVGHLMSAAPGVALIHEPFNLDHPTGVCAWRWRHQYTYVTEDHPRIDGITTALEDTLSFRYRPLAHLRTYENPRRTAGLVRDYPRFLYRRLLSRPRSLFKDPIALFSAPWLARTFDMHVVVLVRHPAAFAWSYKRIGEPNRFADLLGQAALMQDHLESFAGQIARAARGPRDPIGEAALLWRIVYTVVADQVDRHPDWTLRRHEDLCLAPHVEIPKLLEAVGLADCRRVRRRIAATTAPGNPVEARGSELHRLRRDSRRTVTAWRRRLTPREIRRVREGTADVATRFYGPASWLADRAAART